MTSRTEIAYAERKRSDLISAIVAAQYLPPLMPLTADERWSRCWTGFALDENVLQIMDEYAEYARKVGQGGKARWAELPYATHDGPLQLGGATIQSAVLNDKRRVLTQSDVMRALGRARQAKGRSYYDGDVNLPVFLTAKNLKPFIPNDLYVTSSQIEFRRKNGGKAFGYPAELLPKICSVFVDAYYAGKLTEPQKKIAIQAKTLLSGLAQTAIIALVDEATGYQEVRPKDELQKILALREAWTAAIEQRITAGSP